MVSGNECTVTYVWYHTIRAHKHTQYPTHSSTYAHALLPCMQYKMSKEKSLLYYAYHYKGFNIFFLVVISYNIQCVTIRYEYIWYLPQFSFKIYWTFTTLEISTVLKNQFNFFNDGIDRESCLCSKMKFRFSIYSIWWN